MNAYVAGPEKNEFASKAYTIGIAEHKIAQSPDRIITLGLGSCIGLVLYDPIIRLAGMVHIMLPCASDAVSITNRFKFADTAIADMLKLLTAAGAVKSRLKAKMAGGAHMFKTSHSLDIMNVGQRNIAMCKKALGEHGIKICGEDTGGNSGRSVEFCCETCVLSVRTMVPKGFLSI